MRLLFVDETEKILKLPEDKLPLGFSHASLLKQQERENAALLICASQLGINHLVYEIIDYRLTDLMPELKKCQYFRFDAKRDMNKARKMLSEVIAKSYCTSLSDKEYMMDKSDNVNDRMSEDLSKLKYSLTLKLQRSGVNHHYTDIYSEMILIDLLFDWVTRHYDSVIKLMMSYQNCFYDSWFGLASGKDLSFLWNKGMNRFFKFANFPNIDLNEEVNVINGLKIFNKKIQDKEIIGEEVDATTSELDKDLLEACQILGININKEN